MEGTLYIKTGDGIQPLGNIKSIDLSLDTFSQTFIDYPPRSFSLSFTILSIDLDRRSVFFERYENIDSRTRDPHFSYYIPFYFPVCSSSRNKATKPVSLPTKKVERNVRPKGTHTHCKFCR